MSPTIEPTAAERIDTDQPCEYEECDQSADWKVELNHETLLYCCHDCGRSNRVHPYDVEDYEIIVEEDDAG